VNIPQDVVKEPESLAIIRFQDCDPFGHLNNARYIDYFINAREDHLSKFYDFRIFEWGKINNESWVVTQNQIAYLRPAVLIEEVVIRTCLIHYGESTILIEAVMLDKAKKHVKAVLWSEFTYVSLANGKKIPQREELIQFMRAVLIENSFWSEGFAARAQQLKRPMPKSEPQIEPLSTIQP